MFKWFWTGYILVGCPWIMLKKEKVENKTKKQTAWMQTKKQPKTDGNGLIKGIHNLVGNVY